jgi:hypothetical protein
VDDNHPLGATWDGTDEQKDEIAHHFDAVADWARRHDARIRWTAFIREQADIMVSRGPTGSLERALGCMTPWAGNGAASC